MRDRRGSAGARRGGGFEGWIFDERGIGESIGSESGDCRTAWEASSFATFAGFAADRPHITIAFGMAFLGNLLDALPELL